MSNRTKNYLSFKVAGQWYGLDINNVLEVLNFFKLSEPPIPSEKLIGLARVYDRVVPVIDLRRYWGISNPEYRLSTPIIMVQSGRYYLGFVVDEVNDVEAVSSEQIITYNGPTMLGVSDVVKLPDRMLMLLDVEEVSDIKAISVA